MQRHKSVDGDVDIQKLVQCSVYMGWAEGSRGRRGKPCKPLCKVPWRAVGLPLLSSLQDMRAHRKAISGKMLQAKSLAQLIFLAGPVFHVRKLQARFPIQALASESST